jgi:hypothetical protein
MGTVSKPLLAALGATVVLAIVWLVALKPGSPSPATPALAPATHAPAPATHALAPARVAPGPRAVRVSTSAAGATTTNRVYRALRHHETVAVLFYNPRGADDRLVARELRTLDLRARRLARITVPIGQLSHYAALTNQVPVESAPTLIVVDPDDQARTIVGFSDRFEIRQRILSALAVR